jgi:hypothetical protein
MKKDVLNRYERDSGGSILIDVAADKVEDLYSDFDKSAPYIRRDLDQDLVDYLIDCARELGNEPFTISFTLVNPPDDTGLSRIRGSINNFFLYLVEIERQKVRQMLRRSFILFCIGIAILCVSVWVNRWLGSERTVVAYVFSEGLIVAAWVSLWESLATFLIEWFPRLRNIKLYRRLASVQPMFRSGPETRANGDMGLQSAAQPDRE